ncbi:hypothetical protein [Streptomyces viridochromogenes]|uniref:hypothetical protein n=1 Tax=Streptomyces viridochromogenes TaxID=1938 RepID=UPI00069F7B03|nr:hypothetical protein [Streptomyces viridochromogenes]KOG21999.1 hypothetical protein ADK36_13745 [Streptomyces viridochromogenes]
MAALSAQRLAVAGAAPSYSAAAAGGDTAPVGKGLVLHVVNGSGSAVTVTVVTPGTIDGLAVADAALSVPAGASGFIPLGNVYRNPSTNRAAVTYSATTTVSVAVLQLP